MLQKLQTRRGGFTLVEIMIVVAIIALLAAIAVPNFLRARKRSQATRILEELRLIDAGIDQYAIEANLTSANTVSWDNVVNYLKKGSKLYLSGGKDMLGSTIVVPFNVDVLPSVPKASYDALSDVAPISFWSPFPIGS
jgi:prepilin-type N-terminal cleavage/methylation domain-containing protein